MKKSALFAVLFALVTGNATATYLLTRSASVMKPLQVIGYAAAGFSRTTQEYDTLNKKYVTLPADEQTSTLSTDVMLGLSLLKNLEVIGVAPVVSKSKGDATAVGLGDAALMLRYGLVGGILPVKLTLAAAVNLPTSAKGAVLQLGDRTTDVAIGAALQTVSVARLALHARFAYWLNGKAGETKHGNMFEYVIFPDFTISPNASIFSTVAGVLAADNVVSGAKQAASGAGLHSAGLGLTWNPVGPLWFKPKVTVPLTFLSRGGRLPSFALGFDVWAVVP